MIGLKVKNGIVDDAALFNKIPNGWIEAPDGVGIGWTDNGDGTFTAPPVIVVTLQEAKDARTEYVNSERDKAINGGVAYGGNNYDTDSRSRENLTGVHTGVNDGYTLPVGFVWRTSDNVNVAFTKVEINGLAYVILDHVNVQYGTSWALKASIESATTVHEVNAVVWP